MAKSAVYGPPAIDAKPRRKIALALAFLSAISFIYLAFPSINLWFSQLAWRTGTHSVSSQPNSHHKGWEYQNPGQIRAVQSPKKNTWKALDEDQYYDVEVWVNKKMKEMEFVESAGVIFVEKFMPNKSEVIIKEDSSITSEWARVVIVSPNEWSGKYGGISEWQVGPLPISQDAQIIPIMYNSGRNFVQRPVPDFITLLSWFSSEVNSPRLAPMMTDLIGKIPDLTTMSNTPGLMAVSHPTTTNEANAVEAWLTVHSVGELDILPAFSLLPQGMYAHIEIRGPQKSDWSITAWFYNGVLYNSTDTLHQRWREGNVEPSVVNLNGNWTNTEPEEIGIEGRDLPAPVMVQPHGPRVEVDAKQGYVKWMGYEFFLSFSQVTSLGLFDIRFRGERILYELSLQEAMAHYAGNSPASNSQLFYDTLFGMGLNSFELVPGYDCPAYATYLPATFYREGKFITRKNAICIFEAIADHPIQRHTTASKVTVSKNHYLVVRFVSTVGNYDYTVSYLFYLDGSIEIKVQASGYIFSDYYALDMARKEYATEGETQIYEYGYKIHDVVVSSLHTHEILFKADFDINGTSNTLYDVAVEPLTRTYPWENGKSRNTMHLVHNAVEKEAGLNWKANSQGAYVILNNDSTNAWGEKRGYKIVPGTGMGSPPHMGIINSTAMAKSAGWAYHNIWVLRNHDHERKAVSEWNAFEVQDPLVNFDRMVDGERTVQEDLVVYFNLGVHHIANSADIPNTLMHWSGTSIMLVPHNYHDREMSRHSSQGAMMQFDEVKKKAEDVKYFGARYGDVHLRKEDVDPDLSAYRGPNEGLWALSSSFLNEQDE